MYLIEAFFKSTLTQPDFAQQTQALNAIIDQWRYNGQIIGREIPLYLTESERECGFTIKVICPEIQSLAQENNHIYVQEALHQAEKCGLYFDHFCLLGEDLNAEITAQTASPSWQILYTTHLQTCSPLHSGEDFSPIPLYKQCKNQPHLSQDLIKWQENWQACDQLQMNGSALEQQALNEISDFHSVLSKHGYNLAQSIEKHTAIPTYYYLYRAGGVALSQEQQRKCPCCGQDWALPTAIFDIFHFKCDPCRLVSNLSWNFL